MAMNNNGDLRGLTSAAHCTWPTRNCQHFSGFLHFLTTLAYKADGDTRHLIEVQLITWEESDCLTVPGCDGVWSLGHIPVTSTPGSSLSHWRSWPSSISWGGAVRTGETFRDCSSGPAIKSLTCSLTLETCELLFEVTVKIDMAL